MSEWTEGVCDDGAAILRDGQPVTISELLAILNDFERLRSDRDAAVAEMSLLLDRLADVDFSDVPEPFMREWMGHVEPAILRAAAIRARGTP